MYTCTISVRMHDQKLSLFVVNALMYIMQVRKQFHVVTDLAKVLGLFFWIYSIASGMKNLF